MSQDNNYQHLEDALSGFTDARVVIKEGGDSLFPLQYKGSKFDFYRFVNRYRMAKQFRGIQLEGFEQPTEDGYSSLTRQMGSSNGVSQRNGAFTLTSPNEIDH